MTAGLGKKEQPLLVTLGEQPFGLGDLRRVVIAFGLRPICRVVVDPSLGAAWWPGVRTEMESGLGATPTAVKQ